MVDDWWLVGEARGIEIEYTTITDIPELKFIRMSLSRESNVRSIVQYLRIFNASWDGSIARRCSFSKNRRWNARRQLSAVAFPSRRHISELFFSILSPWIRDSLLIKGIHIAWEATIVTPPSLSFLLESNRWLIRD